MKFLHYFMAVAAAAAFAAPALAAPNTMNNMHNMMSKTSLNINMAQQRNSNENGTASVKDVPGGVLVKISLQNEPKGASQPAHIHQGTCATLNPAPWKPLSNVVNGTSVTTVKGIKVADLKKAHYAINVHLSAANIPHYVSCGDL